MSLIIDPHVHLYPCYDIKAAFDEAVSNLSKLARDSSSQIAIILTERADCNFFAQLGGLGLPFEQLPEGIWRYNASSGAQLLVYPGRQVISSERIEVLALLTDQHWPDRQLACAELLQSIRTAGGLPVINWAPGKWWGKRGAIVSNLLDDRTDRPLLVCDTTLRPTVWPEPAMMRKATSQGAMKIAGSDPLPLSGEQNLIGTYATRLEVDIDLNRPLSAMRKALIENAGSPTGKRSSVLQFIGRMARLKFAARHSQQRCLSSTVNNR